MKGLKNGWKPIPGNVAALIMAAGAVVAAALPLPAAEPSRAEIEFFEARIRPVLVAHCYECHSAAASEVKGSLRLDSREGLRTGGDSGPAVVPGAPDESLLLDALRHETFEMPPGKRLPERVVADFQGWIERGAMDPRDAAPSAAGAAEQAWRAVFRERLAWWSLQPLQPGAPPVNAGVAGDWSRQPVDRFVLAALRERRLEPAADADAATLLRRLCFVLTGLPPSVQQASSFPARYQAEPDTALRGLVDELLGSPHFGQRFARHWMDVVRYTDTYGYEWDNPAKGSWEYRDYLIRAFNRDVGFDQLAREQVAGDLLDKPRLDRAAQRNESLIGPMFYHLGEHRHGDSLDFNGIHQEMINNKIDAFSKAFLASTVACARCHDHKLDAISQRDYYALAGVFMSPRWTSRVIDLPGKYAAEIAELKELRSRIRQELAAVWLQVVGRREPAAYREWARQQDKQPQAAVEQISYPLLRLVEAEADADVAEVAARWGELVAAWQAARAERIASNEQEFAVLADFREPGLPAGWSMEGAGMRHGYVGDGEPLVALEGPRAVVRLLPRGYHTHALSSKLPGAVRPPAQQQVASRHVSLRLAGGEWAGHLVVPQNAFQTESVTFLNQPAGAWTAFADKPHGNGVTRVLVEVATSSLNPGFPPRTGKARAGRMTLDPRDNGLHKRSWFSLTGIVAHEAPGAPADTLDAFAPLYDDPLHKDAAPTSRDQAWQRVSDWLAGAARRWAAGEATPGDVRCLNGLLDAGLLPNASDASPRLAGLVKQYRDVEARIGFARTVNSMDERGVEPVDYRLNVRGNVDEEGEPVPRDFLQAFAGQQRVGESPGSGRRELARWLTSPDNPITARVYVNRVWQWVFGTGLVATPNDFGKLGDRPSHPELLDWLAWEFMREGWSTKQLVRRLVLSRTFRQSGAVTAAGRRLDPDNRLLHHYPTRRLEAEAIRDSLLAVCGRLDESLYGPPMDPPRASEDAQKRLFSGPLDGNGRRSLYTKMSIMAPPPLLVGFNLPDLKLPTGRRDVTNVPAQALILLNDPLVARLAEQWSERLLEAGHADAPQRIRAMFLAAYGREPDEDELRRWSDAAAALAGSEPLLQDQATWTALAHALLNTSEFIYYR